MHPPSQAKDSTKMGSSGGQAGRGRTGDGVGMALHDLDLLDDHNGKELPPEWALHRFQGTFQVPSLGTQLMKPHGAPFCTICCPGRTSLQPSRQISGGLGPKVPLPSGPHQCCAHLGEAAPPVPRGGSLAGCTPGQTGGQRSYWPNFARGAAAMCYTIALSAGHLVWAALLGMPKHCPSQQMDGQVSVPTQQYEAVPGITRAG